MNAPRVELEVTAPDLLPILLDLKAGFARNPLPDTASQYDRGFRDGAKRALDVLILQLGGSL